MAENRSIEVGYITLSKDPSQGIDPIEVQYKMDKGIKPEIPGESKVIEGKFPQTEVKKGQFLSKFKENLLTALGLSEEEVLEDEDSLVVPAENMTANVDKKPVSNVRLENNVITGVDFKSGKKDR